MDRSFFAQQMALIANAYMKKDYMTEKVLTTWYEFLKDIPEDRLTNAIKSWVRANRVPPTIADIEEECLKIRVKEAIGV